MASPVVHETAIVDLGAELGDGVEVGPFAVVGAGVVVGSGTRVGAHALIEGETAIGEGCRIGPHVVLGTPPQVRGVEQCTGALHIGSNNTIREFATVHRGSAGSATVIGSGNLIMAYAHVAHDCQLGDACELANGAQLAGHVELGHRVTVGGLAGVHQRVRVGDLALIAAGAMVSQDVLPYCRVGGDRARLQGLNTVGLRRAGIVAPVRARLARCVKVLMAAPLLEDGIQQAERLGEADPHVAALIAFVRRSERGLCRETNRNARDVGRLRR